MLLIFRKSSHAADEQNEWFSEYNKRLDKLKWREAKVEKENEKKVITVKAFSCKECKTILETANRLCREKGHSIIMVTAQKRYFECQKCRKLETTIGSSRLPERACKYCGSYNFTATGKSGSGTSSSTSVGLFGERLVTGKTEWSSRMDLDQLSRSSSGLN